MSPRPGDGAVVAAVVDPADPGAAPDLADEVVQRAVAEAGTSAGVLTAPTRAALLGRLAEVAAVPADATDVGRLVLVDGGVVCSPTLLGDLVAGPRPLDHAGLVQRDGRDRVVGVPLPARAR
ncbi:hypothetical protein, partial [Angustibacter aerolatus]